MKLTSCDVYASANPENAYFLFYTRLMKAYDSCLPLVNVKNNNYRSLKKPWITEEN